MTPEQQQIAIAEACGWYDLVKQDVSLFGKHEPESQKTFELDVPDYLNDLNAMHEAEKVLTTRAQISQYVWELERLTNWKADYIVGSDGKQYLCPASYFCCVNATATQRAEAFLRTLNLWTT